MKEFTKQDMLNFAKYYYDLNRCRQSLEKELNEWSTEMEASKISSNDMLSNSLPDFFHCAKCLGLTHHNNKGECLEC